MQAPAPSRPIARGLAGPGLLAHVLVSKYADHLPLYRQSQIYAREGVELDRSTLADWVGGASELLAAAGRALGRYVLGGREAACRRHAGAGAAPGPRHDQDGRLWAYVRDDRPAGSDGAAGGAVPLLAGSQGRAPARTPEQLQRRPAGRRLCRLRAACTSEPHPRRRRAGRTCGASSTTSTPRNGLADRRRGAGADRRALRDRGRDPRPAAR